MNGMGEYIRQSRGVVPGIFLRRDVMMKVRSLTSFHAQDFMTLLDVSTNSSNAYTFRNEEGKASLDSQ